MSVGTVVNLMSGGIVQIITLSLPVLGVAMGVGLIISIFQATTSIQDQTLTFVPKIVAIMVTLGILGKWMVERLVGYTTLIFEQIAQF